MTTMQAMRYLRRNGRTITPEAISSLTRRKPREKFTAFVLPQSDLRDRILGRVIFRTYDAIEGCEPLRNQPTDIARMQHPVLKPITGDKPFRGKPFPKPSPYVGQLKGHPWRDPNELPKYKASSFVEGTNPDGTPHIVIVPSKAV